MKIKVIDKPYREVMAEKQANPAPHRKPIKPNLFFRTLMRLVSIPDLLATKFKFKKIGMERLKKKEPAFFLMNHSSFIDLEIAATVLYPRPFNIVATTDAFMGKDWLMRKIGCIPTKKFVSDPTLVKDMMYTVKKLKSSVVMYPEVGYSIDGRATVLPDSIGKCVKLLGVPLALIRTYGAFTRDPLYNNLQRRKVSVSAEVEYLLSPEEIANTDADKITELIRERFSFDNFSWQKENGVKVDEPFRADGLERILYKCPSCLAEGKTEGKGIHLTCRACGKKYTLDEYGQLYTDGGVCEFPHIPDWYDWERAEVKKEIDEGEYSLDEEVEILVSHDTKRVFRVGDGRLRHTEQGFLLTGEDLHYEQKPLASYSMCADFNWYELGDIVSIGDHNCLYYCFPKNKEVPVIKVRLATEEIYKKARAAYDEHLRECAKRRSADAECHRDCGVREKLSDCPRENA